MINIQDVFRSVNDTLKTLFPDAKVYKERIRKLYTPSLSVELVSISTLQHSKHIINKKIDLDIIYFSKSNNVGEALAVCDRLMSAFSMGIYVRSYDQDGNIIDKRYIHCLKPPEYKLVDQDLHFLVQFDFADEYMPSYLNDYKEINRFSRDNRGLKLNEAKNNTGDKDHENKNNIKDKDKEDKNNVEERDQEDRYIPSFEKDLGFTNDDDRKAYEDEGLKYMENLKLEYEL